MTYIYKNIFYNYILIQTKVQHLKWVSSTNTFAIFNLSGRHVNKFIQRKYYSFGAQFPLGLKNNNIVYISV